MIEPVISDLRVCFVGDSFVAGVGDAEHLGWVGRLAVRTENLGQPLTVYNLGVRRDTSADVLARWERECRRRLTATSDSRIVLSAGVNDTALADGLPRVPQAGSIANLRALLRGISDARQPVLVVGPPPVDDISHSRRIVEIDTEFENLCRALDVPYVGVAASLSGDEILQLDAFATTPRRTPRPTPT